MHVTPERFGWKAFGLSCLPTKWVPPFVVIHCEAVTEPDQDVLAQASVIKALAEENISSAQVIVRSSGSSETMEDRGRLVSSVCSAQNVISTIRKLRKSLLPSSEAVYWIVQEYVTPIAKGHLSNERRLSREKRDFIAEFEISPNSSTYMTPVAVRRWRDGTPISAVRLACQSQLQVPTLLKKVALWASQLAQRVHFEWVWSGNALHIVQVDADMNSDSGVSPTLLCTKHLPDISAESLTCFRIAKGEDFERFPKLHNAKIYSELGYKMPPFFVLTDPDVLGEILRGHIRDDLARDLAELTKRPLIVRTDGTDIPSNCREMLPRSDELRKVENAQTWLTSTFREAIEATALQQCSLCLIAHHFIPSTAAAWARAEPKNRIVRIESLWGVPEGLYWYSHDAFEVDTRDPAKPNIRERLRYKGTFIAPDNTGRWIPQHTCAPFDWSRSISRNSWIAEIASTTRKVAEHENHPIVLMWFIDNHKEATPHKVLPWFHSKSEIGTPKAAPRRKLSTARDFRIERVSDWSELKRQVSDGLKIERVVIEPKDPDLVRSQKFAEELSKLAATHNIVVELAGGLLSHAYYMLQRHGAQVECVDLFGVAGDVLEFNKLVRDQIPDLILGAGEEVEIVRLNGDALITSLRQKLVEEALEAFDAKSEDELVDELADVTEVIAGIREALNLPAEQLETARRKKLNRRGGFTKGLMLKRTSLPRSLSSKDESGAAPPLAVDQNVAELRTISDASGLPTSPIYRRVDLRNVNQRPERILTFEAELDRISHLKDATELRFSTSEGSSDVSVSLELSRNRAAFRGTLRIRIDSATQTNAASDLQLSLAFPDEDSLSI
jgi:predicted house-cleaning noncanonical NTP pyrophosphatase (MazG superfamily)